MFPLQVLFAMKRYQLIIALHCASIIATNFLQESRLNTNQYKF